MMDGERIREPNSKPSADKGRQKIAIPIRNIVQRPALDVGIVCHRGANRSSFQLQTCRSAALMAQRREDAPDIATHNVASDVDY
jgi:hypothetical protein